MRKANGFVRRIPKNADGAHGFKKNVKKLATSALMRDQLTLNATMKKINGFVSGIPRIAAGTHGFKKNAKRLATCALMVGQLILNAKTYGQKHAKGMPKTAILCHGCKINVKRLVTGALMRDQRILNATMKKINGFVSEIPRIAAGTHGFKKNAKRLATNVLMMGQLMLNAKIYSPCLVEGMPETVIQCSGCKRSVKKRAISAPMKRTMELIIKKHFLTFKLFVNNYLL